MDHLVARRSADRTGSTSQTVDVAPRGDESAPGAAPARVPHDEFRKGSPGRGAEGVVGGGGPGRRQAASSMDSSTEELPPRGQQSERSPQKPRASLKAGGAGYESPLPHRRPEGGPCHRHGFPHRFSCPGTQGVAQGG